MQNTRRKLKYKPIVNFVNFAKDTLTNKEAVLLDFIRKTMCTIRSADVAKRPAIPV